MTISQSSQPATAPSGPTSHREMSWLAVAYLFLGIEALFLFGLDSIWGGGLAVIGAVMSTYRYLKHQHETQPQQPPTIRSFAAAIISVGVLVVWILVNAGHFGVSTVQAQPEPRGAPTTTASAAPSSSSGQSSDHAKLPLSVRANDLWKLPFMKTDYQGQNGAAAPLALPTEQDLDATIIQFLNRQLVRGCLYDSGYADGIFVNGAADPLYPAFTTDEMACPVFSVDGTLGVDNPAQQGSHRQYHGTVTVAAAQQTGTLRASWTPTSTNGIWTFTFTPDASD